MYTRSSRILVTLICVWSITLLVSIDMLQIHSYAQLAHWTVITLTTVEDRCEKDQTPHGPSLMWFFKSRLFQPKKIKQNHSIQVSMSRLSPEYQRLISSSLYSNMLQLMCLTQIQTRSTQQSHTQLPEWYPRPRSLSYTNTKQARCDRPRLLSFRVWLSTHLIKR